MNRQVVETISALFEHLGLQIAYGVFRPKPHMNGDGRDGAGMRADRLLAFVSAVPYFPDRS